MLTLTDQEIVDALVAANGLLLSAANYLSVRLGRPVTRAMVEQRVASSRVLSAARQIAEQRYWDHALAGSKERRREKRSASMKAAWDRRKGQADAADNMEQMTDPNAPARPRASRALTAADVRAARDQRLCMAKTRKGTPCIRRVVPGKDRCPSHGGKSTGPLTAEGKARIAAAQRERWERWRFAPNPQETKR
jgi:hypothetical protein